MPQSRLSADRAVRKVRTLAAKGRIGEALTLASAEIRRFPDDKRLQAEFATISRRAPAAALPVEAEIERLKALYGEGLFEEVVAGASRLAPHFPRFPILPKLLGGAYQQLERHDRAAGAFRLAALLTPNDVSVQRNLGAVLAKLGRHGEAVAAFDAALRLDPADYRTTGVRAVSLAALSRQAEAMAGFDAAIALAPADLALKHDRALAEIAFGETEAARTTLAAILERAPHHAESHATLSRIRRYGAGDPHIAEMEAILERGGLSEEGRVHLHFALGKAHDEAGDTDRAFSHFAAANQLKRRQLPYAVDAQAAMFAKVRDGFAAGFVERFAGHRPATALRRRPIFILGMPRSGTTVTEQILASHSMVRGGGEMRALRNAVQPLFDRLVGQDEAAALEALGKIREAYGRALDEIGGDEPVVTDKMPANFVFAGFLPLIFPEATVIHLSRDPMATCWSNFRQHFAEEANGYVYDLADLGRYHLLHDAQMAFFKARMPGAIHELVYERLTEDQERETRALLSWCGLDFEPACLDFHTLRRRVETASRTQVQRPMYRGSSDEWRRYAAHLGPLAESLGIADAAAG
ncbi:tetratricopeptide repeat-containing sulfotransferase family protein [Jiella sonneratiae]|uniref:Sulfotransferase n=1 Tax=Jiella sonneratiae TaxID=2816856 RepID=A0ABS3J463_9HYPH|nr:tetratricopeptide repeat-containing sulfotransferase family protein [Jiella sonneratiae]MBO0904468.1 sulfotransferase [Jiella sonneratiae]